MYKYKFMFFIKKYLYYSQTLIIDLIYIYFIKTIKTNYKIKI